MIEINKELLSPDLTQKIKNLELEVNEFRDTPLDKIALEKLREHFRTHHIYHSAGIEGNRLTMAETAIVLKEGIDISGKPLKDSIEVKNLGLAFDFLYDLSQQDVPISENYIKQIHKLIIGDDPSLSPGDYRNIGVIITGSEHRPPEPFEVPIKMMELVEWIRENENQNPIIVAAIAHHEFVKIHPFKDGNGRTARILLNLILLKKGFPICNIRRDERPMYYEALSLADTGVYEPIVEVVAENTQNFEEVKNWMNQRDLYNKLDDSTAIVGQSQQLQSYLEEKQTESIGQSEDFSKMITALNDNAVLSDSVLYTAKIAEAGQKNEEIAEAKQYEAAQKTINSIYLNKVNKEGISEFSASEKAQISNIAHQCVFVYGNAVYLARALYALDHPEEILMDYLLCANSYKKEEESTAGEKIIDLKIIPNPANEKVLMICDLRGYLDATLQITDITGQVVLTQKLDINTPLTEINTSYFSSGIYYPKIVADHQLIGGKKIVIAH